MNADYLVLKDDLRAIGVREGDSIIIHSSYKSMGGIEGGIETFVDAMLSVLGDSGTLISPTLSFRAVSVENPVFDYEKSCFFSRLHYNHIAFFNDNGVGSTVVR